MFYRLLIFSTVLATCLAFTSVKPKDSHASSSDLLYDSIIAMDAAWEDAYNNCKLTRMEELISDDLEFYHDQGGLMTSKKLLIEALQKNICGKVTRELKKGSIEVSPIPGYGAVELGMHAFHNIKEPNATSHFSKFVHVWKKEKGTWRITRVISLH